MYKCAVASLGCKVNQCESESIKSAFAEAGYEIVSFDEPADVYVINTCCVTSEGERKSRQIVRRAIKQNKDAIVVVTGCAAQKDGNEFASIEGVNIVAGNNQKHNIVSLVEQKQNDVKVEDMSKFDKYIELHDFIAEKTRAFVKIQDGCNSFCSYCIIPYVRGRECSRELENIKKQCIRLADNGFLEIVLTGIHLSSYGKELGCDLADAVETVCDIDTVRRVRLGSLEQRIITDEFLLRLKKLDKFCPQFHLSLQSGCDTVLKRMNRKYTTEDFLNSVKKIYSVFPDAAITTDIITGFPGETDKEFKKSVDFAKKVGFAQAHIFPYSEREGTVAAKMPDQVPKHIREQRAIELISVCNEISLEYRKRFLGKTVSVLCETFDNKTQHGLTKEHISVSFEAENQIHGEVDVKITKITTNGMFGERI